MGNGHTGPLPRHHGQTDTTENITVRQRSCPWVNNGEISSLCVNFSHVDGFLYDDRGERRGEDKAISGTVSFTQEVRLV